jgi:hypothetical protein
VVAVVAEAAVVGAVEVVVVVAAAEVVAEVEAEVVAEVAADWSRSGGTLHPGLALAEYTSAWPPRSCSQ